MRILIISDSHAVTRNIDYALLAHPEARHVFFLGDNVRDKENVKIYHPDRIFHIVHGNCDYDSAYPSVDTVTLGGKKIIFTHGHNFAVKSGSAVLLSKAKNAGADIVLYGHTHVAKAEYIDGIYAVNPGSIAHSREGNNSYAVIDIEQNGIMPIIIKI